MLVSTATMAIKKQLYPMKERRLDFLGFFSGNSLIRCIEFRVPPWEFRLFGATFSEFRLPIAPFLSSSPPPSDFLINGRLVDSLSARGLFTAWTSSVTELVAISFWRAAKQDIGVAQMYVRQKIELPNQMKRKGKSYNKLSAYLRISLYFQMPFVKEPTTLLHLRNSTIFFLIFHQKLKMNRFNISYHVENS